MSSIFLRENINALAEATVERQYACQPEIWKPRGSNGRLKSVRDARYHLDYLAEAVDAGAPELFTSYLAWVKVLFAGLNFPETALATMLDCTYQVLNEQLPPDQCAPVLEIINEGIRRLPSMPLTLASFITGSAPLDEVTRQYLDALLAGERATASCLILETAERGTSVKDIYLQVFQRAQREIGRLWQTNQISVAQEHYCTAATQLIMSQLYPRIFATEKNGHALVATCVGEELHEIGARMVADLLELDGWDTYFLGANTPTASILRMVEQHQAAVLAISATMTFHLDKVRELIVETRHADLPVRVLVGGYTFNRAPQLWHNIGADGYAPDADQATRVAASMVTR